MHNIDGLPADILAQVKKCAAVIRAGGIAAYPTDTVYGLGADVFNREAVTKVFAAKQRPADMPLPILVADLSQLDALVAIVPLKARLLIDRFWPGALTLVFDKAHGFDSPALAGGTKIALRMPGHNVTLRLIKEAGQPIVGTSANLHGGPSTLTAAEVRTQLGYEVDFILDGGPCPGGVESTVVDITGDKPFILRAGAISRPNILDLIS